jgi:hypothetical protein
VFVVGIRGFQKTRFQSYPDDDTLSLSIIKKIGCVLLLLLVAYYWESVLLHRSPWEQ